MHADSGYPDGEGGPADIDIGQLGANLVHQIITKISFDEGDLVVELGNGTVVTIRGNSMEDRSVAIDVALRN